MSSQVTVVFFFICCSVYLATSSQPPCGPRGLQCIKGMANCINNKCVCRNRLVWGDGWFNCYRRNQVAAETRNDPTLTTFNNETYEFPYPCRYLMTHVRQELKDSNRDVIGYCEFKVHMFNDRARGKVFTHGMDIAAKVEYTNGTVVNRSVRKYGVAKSGVNEFTVLGSHDYSPDGPWFPNVDIYYEDAPNNIEIKCFEDGDNNQLVFEFQQCGVRTTLVPYDVEDRRNQAQIPGASVAVNCAHHPVWLSKDEVLGLPPYWQKGFLVAAIVIPGLTESQSLVDRAFRNGAVQNQPDAHPACTAITPVVNACNDTARLDAYEHCWWMLTQPRYVRCISLANFNFVDIFKRCVDAWCSGGDCASIVSDLGACDHVGGIDILHQFINGTRCP